MREPYFSAEGVTLYFGDCRTVVGELPAASVDAVVTDPPYELAFMGKRWDATGIAYDIDLWREVMRVLKPGGHLLAFGGTRTWHRLAVAIEDAGFEVRDSICWLYGSGFPKSLDVSKAIDKAAGAERQVLASRKVQDIRGNKYNSATDTMQYNITAPATDAAKEWQGWGTALKPAFEPIVVARKPLIGTVAENVLAHGTGALNIDGCRIAAPDKTPPPAAGYSRKDTDAAYGIAGDPNFNTTGKDNHPNARWPANVILDESQAAELDKQSGDRPGFSTQRDLTARDGTDGETTYGKGVGKLEPGVRVGFNDTGGASRFFYVPKANSSERPRVGETAHPTVKPLELMRYLVKLVTPPGGTVLEPFAGSGTTLEACLIEGFNVIGIELTEDYLPLIVSRISKPIEAVLL